jgi:predicted nucleotidyltransferase
MKSSKLHALASAFAAYLLDRAGESVNAIYLFGSVARGEATADSDIDIFVDTAKGQQAKIKLAAERFEATTAAKAFRAVGIKNPIRTIAGSLESPEFSELKLGIAAEGIILYGKGFPKEKGRQPYLLIWFSAPKVQSHKVAFLRTIYGRKEQHKSYPGLLQKIGGFKAGSNTALIPIRHRSKFLSELKKARVKYSIKNVWL